MLGPVSCDARQDVDQDHLADEVGCFFGQGDGGQAAERHSHDGLGRGSDLTNGDGHIGGVAPGVQLPLGKFAGAVGMTVPGQVDSHQRTVKGHGHGVPGVGVLGSAVEKYQFRFTALPDQSTQLAPAGHVHRDAPHDGRFVEGQSEFRGVLVEQSELVVLDAIRHLPPLYPLALESPRRTALRDGVTPGDN